MILECELLEGKGKTSGKEYRFFKGLAYGEFGAFEFSSNSDFTKDRGKEVSITVKLKPAEKEKGAYKFAIEKEIE